MSSASRRRTTTVNNHNQAPDRSLMAKLVQSCPMSHPVYDIHLDQGQLCYRNSRALVKMEELSMNETQDMLDIMVMYVEKIMTCVLDFQPLSWPVFKVDGGGHDDDDDRRRRRRRTTDREEQEPEDETTFGQNQTCENLPHLATLYMSSNITVASKILVFVTSMSNSNALGIWSRSTLLRSGLGPGSMLLYFQHALELGYGIVVTNAKMINHHRPLVLNDMNGPKQIQTTIPCSEMHLDSVYRLLFAPKPVTTNESCVTIRLDVQIDFCAHGFGGILVWQFIQKYMSRFSTSRLCLIETSLMNHIQGPPPASTAGCTRQVLLHQTMNWEMSNTIPAGEAIQNPLLSGHSGNHTGIIVSCGKSRSKVLSCIRHWVFDFLEIGNGPQFLFNQRGSPSCVVDESTSESKKVWWIHRMIHLWKQRSISQQKTNRTLSKADQDLSCDLCLHEFTIFRLRHICQSCRRTICAKCSPQRLYLPDAGPHAQRVCSFCLSGSTPESSSLVCSSRHDVVMKPPLAHDSSSSFWTLRRQRRKRRNSSAATTVSQCSTGTATLNTTREESLSNQQQSFPSSSVGHITMDDFQLLKVIGKGAFGKVMLVRKKSFAEMSSFCAWPWSSRLKSSKVKPPSHVNNIYAMKVLKKTFVVAKKQVEHTKCERRILCEMDHPFIVRLRFAFQTPEKLYLVMDYFAGGSLFFHLRKVRTFNESRARFYAAQLVLALEHLHDEDIAYRDLKLENILMDARGYIALTDFGLSKEHVTDASLATTFCGTAEYIAPELLTGQEYGKSVDWWGFGTLLYEMLCGKTPYYDRHRKRMFYNICHAPLVFPTCTRTMTKAPTSDPMGTSRGTHSRSCPSSREDDDEVSHSYVSLEAQSLIRGCLVRDPHERLGAADIKAHAFFANVSWDDLMAKQVVVPFRPNVVGDADTSNVAPAFTREVAKDSPGTTFDSSVLQKQDIAGHFEGFTYVPPTSSLA